ncbi:MAG: aminotransferase class V-fold PLP-dependent enzyme, partial [Akkermansia sp.]|nr:aminotransferase class V-fold PLP-dependent enzyme [Akkermansia sp.]
MKTSDLAAVLENLRAQKPLILSLTNSVVQPITANMLLAAGASPVMLNDAEESAQLLRICANGLLINVGTLSRPQAEQMRAAVDAAQSAGSLPVSLRRLGADFIAAPGHKGLLGPQGTGLLLCGRGGQPLLYGGTGVASLDRGMPEDLPERLEAGTLNVPGIAGLAAGIRTVRQRGTESIFRAEHDRLKTCVRGLEELGMKVFSGPHQAATVSFLPGMDCEEAAALLASDGIAL